jgi:hypothetical protein
MTWSYGQLMRSYIDILNENEMQNMKWEKDGDPFKDRYVSRQSYTRPDGYTGVVMRDKNNTIVELWVNKPGRALPTTFLINRDNRELIKKFLPHLDGRNEPLYNEIADQAQTLYDQAKQEAVVNEEDTASK